MRLLFLCTALIILSTTGQSQVKTPAPSPTQTVKQDFGLSSIEINYSRPAVKKRKVFGDLVPYGQVWRTGANGATTLTFGDDVTIGSTKIAAGKYGLLTIPGKKLWTIIISKQTNVTSPAAYKQDMDVVRVQAKPVGLKNRVENFTIGIQNISPTMCDLQLNWDKKVVQIPITTDIESKIISSIDASMKSDKPAYFQAAMYYMENGKDLNQALGWFKKAVDAQPDAFWIQHQLANCYAKLGMFNDARKAAMLSKDLAAKASNGDYVKLNEKLLKQINKN